MREEVVELFLKRLERQKNASGKRSYEKEPGFVAMRWRDEQVVRKILDHGSDFVRIQHQFKMFDLPDGRQSRYGKLGNCFQNALSVACSLARLGTDSVRRRIRYVEGYANFTPHAWIAFGNDWAIDLTWRWRNGMDKVPFYGIAMCPLFAREIITQQLEYLKDLGVRPHHVSALTHEGILNGRFDDKLAQFRMSHRPPK